MKSLDLKFRVDDLVSAGRPMEGVLSQSLLGDCLPGLVGKLGYRTEGDATVSGTVYLSAGGEVVVDGKLNVKVGFDCARCLVPCSASIEIEESHVLVKRKPDQDGDRELVITEDDVDDLLTTYQGDEVDLTDLFRQGLMLALPMNPSCGFAGLDDCVLEERAVDETDDAIDPRWAPLLELKKKLN